MPVPNDLEIKITGEQAVDLDYLLGYIMVVNDISEGTRQAAARLEKIVINAINKALIAEGLPIIKEDTA